MLQAVPMRSRNPTRKGANNSPVDAIQDAIEAAGTAEEAEDEMKSQTRILQLRKAKFRGASVAPRKTTPITVVTSSPYVPIDLNTPDGCFSSPLVSRDPLDKDGDVPPDAPGVLQEISNSSLRRKRNDKSRNSTIPRPTNHGTDKRRDTPGRSRLSASIHPALTADTFTHPPAHTPPNPSKSADAPSVRSPSARRRASRSSRRSITSSEGTKYIEHLESQLAALQTQLQSLISPSSTSKAESAKLRAMNTESQFLRQEVADWETKFSERVREQTEQHDVVVGSLRAQVRSLEREMEAMRDRTLVLETEVTDKDSYAESVESTNQDLERRLEVMSELVATSPKRVDLCPPVSFGSRRKSTTRPLSLMCPQPTPRSSLPRPAFGHLRMSSSSEAGANRRSNLHSPGSPTGRTSRLSEASYLHQPIASMDAAVPYADEDSEMSEGPLTDDLPLSPTKRNLVLQRLQTDIEGRPRPVRKMRRFHGGASGPRTLILPATSVSAHLSPTANARLAIETPSNNVDAWASVDWKGSLRRRSATWDEDSGSARLLRRSGSISALTPVMIHPDPPETPPLAPSVVSSLSEWKPDSARGRYSIGPTGGRNLYEELEYLNDDDANTDGTRSTDRKHQGSRPLSTSSWDLEHSPESSPLLAAQLDLPLPPLACLSPLSSSALDMAESPTPASVAATSPSATTSLHPLRLIYTLAQAVSRTLDRRAGSARSILTNAWDIVMLSRPVLEFRWWLVKLLIGDMHRKKGLWPKTLRDGAVIAAMPQEGKGTVKVRRDELNESGIQLVRRRGRVPRKRDHRSLADSSESEDDGPPSPEQQIAAGKAAYSDDSLADCLTHLANNTSPQTDKTRERARAQPTAAAPTWLRFGVTLVFAVGIALRNGPRRLLVSGEGGAADSTGNAQGVGGAGQEEEAGDWRGTRRDPND